MLEALWDERGSELLVEHSERVAVELGRHATRVVVGRLEPCRVLDQVAPEQQPVGAVERGVEVGIEAAPTRGIEIADGATQEGHQPGGRARQRSEVVEEVRHHGMDLEAGELRYELVARSLERLGAHVERDEGGQGPVATERLDEDPRLLARPRTELEQ